MIYITLADKQSTDGITIATVFRKYIV